MNQWCRGWDLSLTTLAAAVPLHALRRRLPWAAAL